MNKKDILEELRKDILYQIDLQLYDEFNDKFCEINENLGTVYSYKDLEDLKKAESDTERTLLRQAISNLIAENKELKEEIKEINEEYNAEQKHEMENTIPKSKVEEIIQTMNTNILNAEKFDCDYIGQCRFAKYVLQSLLGKE